MATVSEHEEIMWKQRSRIRWLMEGDATTSFFLKVANARLERNRISSILEGEVELSTEKEMEGVLFAKFRSMFGDSTPFRPALAVNLWSDRDGEQLPESLELPFSREEIRGAICNLDQERVPGPDGFPIFFFKTFWDTLGDDVALCSTNFFMVGPPWISSISPMSCSFRRLRNPGLRMIFGQFVY